MGNPAKQQICQSNMLLPFFQSALTYGPVLQILSIEAESEEDYNINGPQIMASTPIEILIQFSFMYIYYTTYIIA